METLNFPDFPEVGQEASEPGIYFHFEDISVDCPPETAVSEWLSAAAVTEGKPLGEVTYIFCSDEYLHKMNVEHLDHDDLTDVITFPYSDEKIEGDVFISVDRVRENATGLGATFHHEICRVMVHGLLHLAGHSDKSPELRAAMSAKEDFYLGRLFT